MRQSRYINRKQAENFLKAIRFAEEVGRPLNTFVSINYDYTACPVEEISKHFLNGLIDPCPIISTDFYKKFYCDN